MFIKRLSNDSTDYETSFSEDELYEIYKKEQQLQYKQEKDRFLQQTEEEFEDYYYSNLNLENSIFNYPGIDFIHFTHLRIKFSFTPSKIKRLVNKRIKFYCSIRYVCDTWVIKRNSIPLKCRKKIYAYFSQFFINDLDGVVFMFERIYDFLLQWCAFEENFRGHKYQRYLSNKEEVELDEDDEQLFLSPRERIERYKKKIAVLNRMLPTRSRQ